MAPLRVGAVARRLPNVWVDPRCPGAILLSPVRHLLALGENAAGARVARGGALGTVVAEEPLAGGGREPTTEEGPKGREGAWQKFCSLMTSLPFVTFS